MDLKTDPRTSRKARGAFFTPPALTDFIATWAIRNGGDRVLEPSCGEAAFLCSTVRALRGYRADRTHPLTGQIRGLDIHTESVEATRSVLAGLDVDAELQAEDFFALTVDRTGRYDAVIGNPPYVRYQNFIGEMRARALQAALRQGVRLTGLASSWAAFTVHASAFLEPEGRLGLVLPAELLSVSYAAEIRRFLLRRFRSVRLVLFERRVFPEVLEEVVLLLAEGHGGASHFEVLQVRDAAELCRIAERSWTHHRPRQDQKWTSAMLPAGALEVYDSATAGPDFAVLRDWGESYLGAVTGNNHYFALSRAGVAEKALPASDLVRISPPGSRHFTGLSFREEDWQRLAEQGQRGYLFVPSAEPSAAGLKFIADGARSKVHAAYKCRVREPWWRVPLVDCPDLLFTYMNHAGPRLLRNDARVHILNSVYGVRLNGVHWELGYELLPLAWLNSVTLLGAEVVGRSYGGGMLKHEPREADSIPVPAVATLKYAAAALRAIEPQVFEILRGRDIHPALDLVDGVVLRGGCGIAESDIAALRQAREALLRRRLTRGHADHDGH